MNYKKIQETAESIVKAEYNIERLSIFNYECPSEDGRTTFIEIGGPSTHIKFSFINS